MKNNSTINTNSPGAKSQVSTQNSRKISNIAAHSLSRSKFCRFLSRLVSYQKPKTIIELGSSLGITTLYLSAAHPEANIYTFEGCPETARLARQLFEKWEFKNIHLVEGNIDDKLPQVLSDCQHVDFAYLDANHKYQPTLNYYECLREKSHEQSIFVLDDIYWSTEMQKAWNEIYQKKEISLSIDLFDAGLLFFESLQKKQHYLLTF
ncbi:class I SAM-dependent methyltransferase [Catalinimonas sp. 4WD22]|uniref:O-methyltransferase n=1 Tax=Catalinimonas locisalis TaxID=3133978 RepID=UPI003100AB72